MRTLFDPHALSVLEEITSVTSPEVATILSRNLGGTVVYFPSQLTDGHWLSALVGQDAAQRLVNHFLVRDGEGRESGQQVLIPMMAKSRVDKDMIRRALEEYPTNREAALALGVHERTLRRHRRGR